MAPSSSRLLCEDCLQISQRQSSRNRQRNGSMRALSTGTTTSLANYTSGNFQTRLPSSSLAWLIGLCCSANKPNVRSRAYAKFKSLECLVAFHKAFNGHIFADSKGSPSHFRKTILIAKVAHPAPSSNSHPTKNPSRVKPNQTPNKAPSNRRRNTRNSLKLSLNPLLHPSTRPCQRTKNPRRRHR